MAKGIFRTSNGWAQVDYGAHSAPIPRYQYEANEYQPPFDSLPFEADYRAAEPQSPPGRAYRHDGRRGGRLPGPGAR
jgi:hypothetical protein